MYYDIPRIRTFADAEKYFNATKPFSRGRNKGKVPVGTRSRGYITMEKVDDKTEPLRYVLRYWDTKQGDKGRTTTNAARCPTLGDVNLCDYNII